MTDSLTEQILRVTDKLAAARELPAAAKAFGADSHGFHLGPPVPEAEVAAFEERHGVTLPAEYRAFVTRVGHGGPGPQGGAGPFYGLLPLDRWAEALELEPTDTVLATPFPVDPDFAYLDWWSEVGLGVDDEPFPGAIALGHEGCGHLSVLVVTGAARGRVSSTYWDGAGPQLSPAPDFLSWYENWLDTVLAG
ncbi:SMI1/KNR4 family protein [Longispora sp. K20-0274]|uniref:SMI1/KNR4 family protein n=1 Tax=Longispora sp. K20-0274 TaxID=3088255 RepID=UPI003999554A